MSVVMTAYVPSFDVFENYWYGNGEIVFVGPSEFGGVEVVVDYGTDQYRADYQAGRFGSGLYYAKVEDIINPGWVDVPGGNHLEPEDEE